MSADDKDDEIFIPVGEPVMVFSDEINTEHNFVVQDDENNVLYEGKEHPWVNIFKRLEEIESKLSVLMPEVSRYER